MKIKTRDRFTIFLMLAAIFSQALIGPVGVQSHWLSVLAVGIWVVGASVWLISDLIGGKHSE